MTITSVGYDGSVDETVFGLLSRYTGLTYAAGGFSVAIGGTGDRAITIGGGEAYGYGVLDTNSAAINLNASAASGTSTRWDTVVISRDWDTNTTTTAIRTGTSTRAISASLTHDPGESVDDQPIALIRVVGGQTAVQQVIDLRRFPVRLTHMTDDSIVPNPAWFGFGEGVVKMNPPGSGQVDFMVRRGGFGTEFWLPLTAPHADGGQDFTNLSYASSGANALGVFNGLTPWFTRSAGRFFLGGALKLASGANFAADGVYTIATFGTVNRPRVDATYPVATSFGGTGGPGRVNISAATGLLTFTPAVATPWFALDGISWFPKGI